MKIESQERLERETKRIVPRRKTEIKIRTSYEKHHAE